MTHACFFSKRLWLEICTTTQNNDLCSSVRYRSYFPFLYGSSKQGEINVDNIDRENKKDSGYKKLKFWRANDFGLIKNHVILKKHDSFWKTPGIFKFITLLLEILKKVKLHLWYSPFSQSLLEIQLLFELTHGISTFSFFNTTGNSMSSTLPTLYLNFFGNNPMQTTVLR